MTYAVNFLGKFFEAGPAANLSADPLDVTVSADAKVVVVPVWLPDTGVEVSGVDIEGEAASLAAKVGYGGGQGTPHCEVWYLLDPPTGANVTVTVTTTGTVFADGFGVAEILGPINITGIGATNTATYGGTASSSASVSLTTTVDDSIVFYAITNKGGVGAPFTDNSTPAGERKNQTDRGDMDSVYGIIKHSGSAGSKTVGATLNTSTDWAIVAVEFKYQEYTDTGDVTRVGLIKQSIGNATNPAHSHAAPTASNRLLVAYITHEDSTDPSDITGVTYAGQAMTQAAERVVDPGTFTTIGELWYLLESGIDAASGSAFAITFSGGTPDQGTVITTAFYRNVKQGAPTDTATAGSTSDDGSGLTISIDEFNRGVTVLAGFHGSSAGISTRPAGYIEVDNDLDSGSQGHSHASYDKLPAAETLGASPLITWNAAQRVGLVEASWEVAPSAAAPVVRGLETGLDHGATAARLNGALVA